METFQSTFTGLRCGKDFPYFCKVNPNIGWFQKAILSFRKKNYFFVNKDFPKVPLLVIHLILETKDSFWSPKKSYFLWPIDIHFFVSTPFTVRLPSGCQENVLSARPEDFLLRLTYVRLWWFPNIWLIQKGLLSLKKKPPFRSSMETSLSWFRNLTTVRLQKLPCGHPQKGHSLWPLNKHFFLLVEYSLVACQDSVLVVIKSPIKIIF